MPRASWSARPSKAGLSRPARQPCRSQQLSIRGHNHTQKFARALSSPHSLLFLSAFGFPRHDMHACCHAVASSSSLLPQFVHGRSLALLARRGPQLGSPCMIQYTYICACVPHGGRRRRRSDTDHHHDPCHMVVAHRLFSAAAPAPTHSLAAAALLSHLYLLITPSPSCIPARSVFLSATVTRRRRPGPAGRPIAFPRRPMVITDQRLASY